MLSGLLMLALSPAAAASTCASTAACNAEGTKIYQAGRYAEALSVFERQIDYADTAIEVLEFEDKPVPTTLQAARETALNNALLASIKGGECLRASAYLELTDAAAPATQANRKLYERECAKAARSNADPVLGDYAQYVGHGAWNSATLRPGAAPGQYILDAFFMRISRGPLDEYGPAAFGSHDALNLRKKGRQLQGSYDSYGDEACTLVLEMGPNGFSALAQERDDCNTGGAGAYFAGEYVRVSTTPSPPSDSGE